jgi:hypothetical protein
MKNLIIIRKEASISSFLLIIIKFIYNKKINNQYIVKIVKDHLLDIYIKIIEHNMIYISLIYVMKIKRVKLN